MKSLKSETEKAVCGALETAFLESPDSVQTKLDNFPKYVRRTALKRFLALYELFKLVLPVKGSVVECGVFRGFSVMAWAKLSAILEPENFMRRIYAFDTFEGFPSVGNNDWAGQDTPQTGEFRTRGVYEELTALLVEHDRDRFLGHMPKVELIRGDAAQTIPAFVEERKHLLVSLLFLDFDLYEPTKAALECFLPRMPKGSVVAFDELDNPIWPGETLALLDSQFINRIAIKRLEWDPYIGYFIVE